MAQQHKLNGTNINYIERPDWQTKPVAQALNGVTPIERWARHIWRTNTMAVSEFDTIHVLEGQKVSLTTTNRIDRNGDYITYYGADLERVSGRHRGPVMTNVTVEFLVRL